MKNRELSKGADGNPKNSFYKDKDIEGLGNPIGTPTQEAKVEPKVEPTPTPAKDLLQDMKQPNKLYRRNITLSEEQFRKLELIKKMKNKSREKGEELITIDKLMFDMIQQYLDSNPYPEINAAFKKYIELKELGYTDFM